MQRQASHTFADVTLQEVDEDESAEAMVQPSRDLTTVCQGIHTLLDDALSCFDYPGNRQQTLIAPVRPSFTRARAA